MCSLILHGIGALIFYSFVYLDGVNIVKNVTQTSIIRWKKVNRLVSTNYKGFFTVLWVSVCMILKAIWISIIQYLNSTIIKLDGNKYLVTYIIKGQTYKMVITPLRGPKKVLMVSDENSEDVSNMIIPYLGPEENFHGEIYTPKFFEKQELIFEMSNGTEKIFQCDEKIVI